MIYTYLFSGTIYQSAMSVLEAIRKSIVTNKLSEFMSAEQEGNLIILNGKISDKFCLIPWACVLPLPAPETGYEVQFHSFGICVQDKAQCEIVIELKKIYGSNCINDCRLLRKEGNTYRLVCLGCGFIGYNPHF